MTESSSVRSAPGDYFGEIALLRDAPRTATVRAHTELNMSELTREVFIPLVSGYGAAALEADSAIGERLAILAGGPASNGAPRQRLRFNSALATPSLAGNAQTATGACLPLGVTSPTCTRSPGMRPSADRVESERRTV